MVKIRVTISYTFDYDTDFKSYNVSTLDECLEIDKETFADDPYLMINGLEPNITLTKISD